MSKRFLQQYTSLISSNIHVKAVLTSSVLIDLWNQLPVVIQEEEFRRCPQIQNQNHSIPIFMLLTTALSCMTAIQPLPLCELRQQEPAAAAGIQSLLHPVSTHSVCSESCSA